ncbi:hypothetical protein [Motilimonas eburnea]|uniref:hypothetical protein n=1 Tax=Motilimonas eburnea TaxID=1737488 RepID=UPI001E2C3507|nr:hypothetical protein [Motilimonas eburnea]MCE2570243.1 hypothetical protein [Motilimonas eburnea]
MKNNQPNQHGYAPLYTGQARIRQLLGYLAIGLIGWIGIHYWLMPFFSQFVTTAHCHDYLAINGITWLWYGLFVGIPLLIFIILAGFGWPNGRRVLRDGQFPAKGKKTFRPTKIRYGYQAKCIGWLQLLAPLVCLGLAIAGGLQAQQLITMPIKASAYELCP